MRSSLAQPLLGGHAEGSASQMLMQAGVAAPILPDSPKAVSKPLPPSQSGNWAGGQRQPLGILGRGGCKHSTKARREGCVEAQQQSKEKMGFTKVGVAHCFRHSLPSPLSPND